MVAAIDFDDERRLDAGEIGNEAAGGMLTSELEPR